MRAVTTSRIAASCFGVASSAMAAVAAAGITEYADVDDFFGVIFLGGFFLLAVFCMGLAVNWFLGRLS